MVKGFACVHCVFLNMNVGWYICLFLVGRWYDGLFGEVLFQCDVR